MKINSVVILLLRKTLCLNQFLLLTKRKCIIHLRLRILLFTQGWLFLTLVLFNTYPGLVALCAIQTDYCDVYNFCGPFGVCHIINQSRKCECMTGFTPKSPKYWEVYNTYGGCVRTSPLECQKGSGFVKYPGVKLPDSSDLWV